MYHMGWWCLALRLASDLFSPVKLEFKMPRFSYFFSITCQFTSVLETMGSTKRVARNLLLDGRTQDQRQRSETSIILSAKTRAQKIVGFPFLEPCTVCQ